MVPLPVVHEHRSAADAVALKSLFAKQVEVYTCGAAAVRHGLLLGGLEYSEDQVINLVDMPPDGVEQGPIMAFLRHDGWFEVEERRKPRGQSTRDFFEKLGSDLAAGAFLLAHIGDGGTLHWVCVGAWKHERIWIPNSYAHWCWTFGFESFTCDEFDAEEWGNFVMIVRPSERWASHYRAWLPERDFLLDMPQGAPPAGDLETLIGRALLVLNSRLHTYQYIHFHLRGGGTVSVKNSDPYEVTYGAQLEDEHDLMVVRPLTHPRKNKDGKVKEGPPVAVFRRSELASWSLE